VKNESHIIRISVFFCIALRVYQTQRNFAATATATAARPPGATGMRIALASPDQKSYPCRVAAFAAFLHARDGNRRLSAGFCKGGRAPPNHLEHSR
jgi:hypothetical protein